MFQLVCEQVRVVLTAAAALDRETQSEHRLRVTAFDAGEPPRTGLLDVNVIVLDANDNSPVFEYSAYEVTRSLTRFYQLTCPLAMPFLSVSLSGVNRGRG